MTLNKGINLLIREFGMEDDRIIRLLTSLERNRIALEHMSEEWLNRWYNRVRAHLSIIPEE